eukprot:SAG31_NODE_5661_length_2398_cov_2.414093_1_plen_129_part_00
MTRQSTQNSDVEEHWIDNIATRHTEILLGVSSESGDICGQNSRNISVCGACDMGGSSFVGSHCRLWQLFSLPLAGGFGYDKPCRKPRTLKTLAWTCASLAASAQPLTKEHAVAAGRSPLPRRLRTVSV